MADSGENGDPLVQLVREAASPSSRVGFYLQLDELEERLSRLASGPAEAIGAVTGAFLDGDRHTTSWWVERNQVLAATCRELEEDCYVFLARQGPVAGDLRRVVTTLRGADHVLRTGSLLGHVATSLTWVDPLRLPGRARTLIRELGEVAEAIYVDAVHALKDADGLAAVELQLADDRADELQKQLLAEVYGGDCSVEEAVSLALMARYYERIADHGVELARDVTWAVTGDRLAEL
jgi:phosphate transport system protein